MYFTVLHQSEICLSQFQFIEVISKKQCNKIYHQNNI